MSSITREEIEAAVRAAWARDTCDPVDVDDWSAANPARGQCGTTALTINDLLGGDLLVAEVVRAWFSGASASWRRLTGLIVTGSGVACAAGGRGP